ncbi:MAG: DNA cytosine methyltransferase [Gemmatimonadaceae bacterium]
MIPGADVPLLSVELCAGAGGQALGLEQAGFSHMAAIDNDEWAVATLQQNRPHWNAQLADLRSVHGADYRDVDLVAGGPPCPPFSIAGKQLGAEDDRDLFPAAIQIIADARPRAVMLENVPGLASARFAEYRKLLRAQLTKLGFTYVDGRVLNACHFNVPQLRPRYVLVALKGDAARRFRWPQGMMTRRTVGSELRDLMAQNGWPGAVVWAKRANAVAPTLVGGSKKHGGPDLGPTRAREAWRALGVDGLGIANAAPEKDFPTDGLPKITQRMAARIQGFPDEWAFAGRKTAAYRQVGNAFPPPVACAVGTAIRQALLGVSEPVELLELAAS